MGAAAKGSGALGLAGLEMRMGRWAARRGTAELAVATGMVERAAAEAATVAVAVLAEGMAVV